MSREQDARRMLIEAMLLLAKAADLAERPASDPIHLIVWAGTIVARRHAKDGTTQDTVCELPDS